MHTEAPQSEYLLLFRNTQLEKRLSMEEMQEAMRRLNDWLQRCQKLGHLVGGQPLANEGKVISGEKQRAVADGPFAESKEAVGGYVLTRAADFDKSTQIASEWPLLDYGASVEVRMVMEKCATMQLVAAEEERMAGCANEGA